MNLRKGYSTAFDYPIILTERDGHFRAAFPDLPSCYGEDADRAGTIDSARAEDVRYILQELEEGSLLPSRFLPEDLCRDNAGEVVMLTLTLPRKENWS